MVQAVRRHGVIKVILATGGAKELTVADLEAAEAKGIKHGRQVEPRKSGGSTSEIQPARVQRLTYTRISSSLESAASYSKMKVRAFSGSG